MIATLAQVALIMAWLCAIQGFIAGWLTSRYQTRFFDVMLCLIVITMVCMVYAFYTSDFSLAIIFDHVQTQLPWYYRVGALWAGHEGSMMLWLFVLTCWSALYRVVAVPSDVKRITLIILSALFTTLIAYILFASSPFDRVLPWVPLEGQDLNPLLQDMGMMFHPPLLYVGYVGFAVPYAMALAMTITQTRERAVETLFKNLVLGAWAFLTLGITLGSFWAYYELGWGGFWFWDPVENASLMPWLVATALVHAMMQPHAFEHRQGLVLLTIWTFTFSLLGTFLVRSGLLSSVHSFASDPLRGFFILSMVMLFFVVAHVIYFKYPHAREQTRVPVTSRESFLTINQVLFIIMTATVCIGTLYPLFIEAFGMGFLSVGPQYFNNMMLPLGAVAMVCMGLSVGSRFNTALRWRPASVIGVIALSVFAWPLHLPVLATLGLALFVWVSLQSVYDACVQRVTRRRVSMHVAHIGFAVCVLGIALSQTLGIEKEFAMAPGDQVTVADTTITLQSWQDIKGPNFEGAQAQLWLDTPHHGAWIMRPEKRFYTFRNIALSETAIDGTWRRDWYIALGEPLDNHAWSFRIQYKPFMRLIWLGGLMMAIGIGIGITRRQATHVAT